MTVKTALINVGNHREDRVAVTRKAFGAAHGAPAEEVGELDRGEAVEIQEDFWYAFEALAHGGGESSRTHVAMAAMIEGPGEHIVRTDFNPSALGSVERIKMLAAALINETEDAGGDPRLTAIAKTTIEEAAMWAVKSATAPKGG